MRKSIPVSPSKLFLGVLVFFGILIGCYLYLAVTYFPKTNLKVKNIGKKTFISTISPDSWFATLQLVDEKTSTFLNLVNNEEIQIPAYKDIVSTLFSPGRADVFVVRKTGIGHNEDGPQSYKVDKVSIPKNELVNIGGAFETSSEIKIYSLSPDGQFLVLSNEDYTKSYDLPVDVIVVDTKNNQVLDIDSFKRFQKGSFQDLEIFRRIVWLGSTEFLFKGALFDIAKGEVKKLHPEHKKISASSNSYGLADEALLENCGQQIPLKVGDFFAATAPSSVGGRMLSCLIQNAGEALYFPNDYKGEEYLRRFSLGDEDLEPFKSQTISLESFLVLTDLNFRDTTTNLLLWIFEDKYGVRDSSYFYENFRQKDPKIKSTYTIKDVGNLLPTEFNLLIPIHAEKKISGDGNYYYTFTAHGYGICIDSCNRFYAKLTIYNKDGTEVGIYTHKLGGGYSGVEELGWNLTENVVYVQIGRKAVAVTPERDPLARFKGLISMVLNR